MHFLKVKAALTGLLNLIVVSHLFADVVVDMTFDDNQNDLEYYWYYYDDNSRVGSNDRPQVDPTGRPSVIDVPYTERERHAFDDKADTWLVKSYKFITSESRGKKCAMMPFTFGDPWSPYYCSKGNACAAPYVGIGTMLTKEGAGIDLTGVKSIHFLTKSRVNPLTVRFNLQTLDIDEYSYKEVKEYNDDEYGYYGHTFIVTPGEWQEYDIAIDSLMLPGMWAHEFEFDIKHCTNLSWEVQGTLDSSITGDTLDIADVNFCTGWIVLRDFIDSTLWMKEERSFPADPAGLFASFDDAPYDRSALKTTWYAFSDAGIGGRSMVSTDYAIVTDVQGYYTLECAEGTGSDGIGRGAVLQYELGPLTVTLTEEVPGFSGIGCSMFDSISGKYWNAAAAGSSGDIYFEYLTDEGADYLTLELRDSILVFNRNNPEKQRYYYLTGAVYFRNFPATNGVWRRVRIPMDSLLLCHDPRQVYVDRPLVKTHLARIEWTVHGSGVNGLFAIDNVCFPGAGVSVDKRYTGTIKGDAFHIICRNRNVRIFRNDACKFTGGKISIIDARGAVVARAAVGDGGTAATISTERLSAGMYFAVVEGMDAFGKVDVSCVVAFVVK
ncbi:MAG: hypothetical protein JW913_03690 [Chitinispirillaceae bacterium]|nr:hypothetical protein [Chitinispirillaceae bacterium]